jgi:hypothetical protein
MCASVLSREPASISSRRRGATGISSAHAGSKARLPSAAVSVSRGVRSRVATADIAPRSAAKPKVEEPETQSAQAPLKKAAKSVLPQAAKVQTRAQAQSRQTQLRAAVKRSTTPSLFDQEPVVAAKTAARNLHLQKSIVKKPMVQKPMVQKPMVQETATRKIISPKPDRKSKLLAAEARPQMSKKAYATSTKRGDISNGGLSRDAATPAEARPEPQVKTRRSMSTHAPGISTKGSEKLDKTRATTIAESHLKTTGTVTTAKAATSKVATSKAATAKAATAKAAGTKKLGANVTGVKDRVQATAEGASKSVVTGKKGVRRSRVPADLAVQYGEKEARRKPSAAAQEKIRRARLDAREREQRRQLMTPDDDLMKRLARAGAITTAPGTQLDEENALHRPKAARRSRKWESRCGKCGVSSTFATPVGLCARCGAIAVRHD